MTPKIKITLVDKLGNGMCHHCHKIGDTFDYDTERGNLCPLAMHIAFIYIDIMRYGGIPPMATKDGVTFACPDVNVLNIFKIEKA